MDGVVHGRIEPGLDAENAQRRLDRFGGDGDAADQAASANRNDQRIELRHGLEHLQTDRTLACDDKRIVVRMDEDHAACFAVAPRERSRLFQGRPRDDHFGAVVPGVLDLHHRRAHRHHDRGGNAEPLGVIGDALRVVACRHCDDAVRTFFRGQRSEAIESAALLERGGELKVFEFEPELAAADAAQRAAVATGRIDDGVVNGRSGGVNVGRCNRKAAQIGDCGLGHLSHGTA
ncbi:hypothetical protein ACVWZ4_005900 [Bradyrhizobium sp. USDA 4472]